MLQFVQARNLQLRQDLAQHYKQQDWLQDLKDLHEESRRLDKQLHELQLKDLRNKQAQVRPAGP